MKEKISPSRLSELEEQKRLESINKFSSQIEEIENNRAKKQEDFYSKNFNTVLNQSEKDRMDYEEKLNEYHKKYIEKNDSKKENSKINDQKTSDLAGVSKTYFDKIMNFFINKNKYTYKIIIKERINMFGDIVRNRQLLRTDKDGNIKIIAYDYKDDPLRWNKKINKILKSGYNIEDKTQK